jgi:hypothetical protein
LRLFKRSRATYAAVLADLGNDPAHIGMSPYAGGVLLSGFVVSSVAQRATLATGLAVAPRTRGGWLPVGLWRAA